MSFRTRRITSLASFSVILLTAMLAVPALANERTVIAVYSPGPDWRPDQGYEVRMLGQS